MLVLLTDGDNTENRWGTNQSDIDRRTEAVCANIRKDTIKIYTVRVVEGNAALLRGCANGGYFEVAQASQLNDVFKSIAKSLATLRIAKEDRDHHSRSNKSDSDRSKADGGEAYAYRYNW